ncbi:hypothetical protein D5R81_20080 [Parashewanella spongiae]|uniref:Lipoprotein n=1 Tax=Parashewanella spongiae TaxID=342950 RepID=A0A3A6TKE3_9GAMM|nr:hypothetical protein [Parashewanella spongiae]MCL1080319.1 hypothetical protein [Parashewanella spongiae]RJY00772.1 hypothetical protein D5R81_20080 [Parashewanella spongiae]
MRIILTIIACVLTASCSNSSSLPYFIEKVANDKINGSVVTNRENETIELWLKGKKRSEGKIKILDEDGLNHKMIGFHEIELNAALNLELKVGVLNENITLPQKEFLLLYLAIQSIELPYKEIVLLQNEGHYDYFRYVYTLGEKSKTLYLPIDLSLDKKSLSIKLGTIIHELNHFSSAIKSAFERKPLALTWRDEYNSHRKSQCFNYWGLRRENKKLNLNVINPAPESIFNMSKLHLKKINKLPEQYLLSQQAQSLVIEHINEFGDSYCDFLFPEVFDRKSLKKLIISNKFPALVN